MSRPFHGPVPARKARQHPCRYHCGAPVLAFRTEDGHAVQLDAQPLPASTDRTHPWVAHRLWRDRGKWVGWVPLTLPPGPDVVVHTEHDCPRTPAAQRPRRG